MAEMSDQNVFATLRADSRIWAVGAIHGQAQRLEHLHRQIGQALQPGDQIVYLGNYSGYGHDVRETIDEMLLFRRLVLARPGAEITDIVYLRGAQEEMWQKLLQLQFAPNPVEVLKWMVDQGIGPSIVAYGASADEAVMAAREGVLSLTRWTGQLRQNMRAFDGHMALMSALRHAAYIEPGPLLFVSAGLDPQRPLSAQRDSFWWGGATFASIIEPYGAYRRIVRGYDRRHGGFVETEFTVTLDGGPPAGEVVAACFSPDGTMVARVAG
jgi:serine/threonine protein phosphatase 1